MAWTPALDNVVSALFVGQAREASRLPFLANTTYQDVADSANQVTIISIGDATIRTYTPGSDITVEAGNAGNLILTCDQLKYNAITIDDTVKNVGDFGIAYAKKAGAQLALAADSYALGLTLKASMKTGNWIESTTAGVALNFNNANSLDVLDQMNEVMNANNVPEEGRFFAAPPAIFTKLMKAGRNASRASDDILFKGKATVISGINIVMSNQYTDLSTKEYKCLFGHADGFAMAAKTPTVESTRIEKQFGTLVKSLFRFGGKYIDTGLLGGAHLKNITDV